MAFKRMCRVYDVFEPDPTKKLLGEFESMVDCAEFLGIKQGHVSEIIRWKTRNRTNKLGKVITIR